MRQSALHRLRASRRRIVGDLGRRVLVRRARRRHDAVRLESRGRLARQRRPHIPSDTIIPENRDRVVREAPPNHNTLDHAVDPPDAGNAREDAVAHRPERLARPRPAGLPLRRRDDRRRRPVAPFLRLGGLVDVNFERGFSQFERCRSNPPIRRRLQDDGFRRRRPVPARPLDELRQLGRPLARGPAPFFGRQAARF